MLTEKRQMDILKLLEEKKSITVQEMKELFQVSESTIRRDLTTLHKLGYLNKVFGGAVAVDSVFNSKEEAVEQREEMNKEDKEKIAIYAASLISEGDYVYIDAGTTTYLMIDYITQKSAVFVTNAVAHAKKLAAKDLKVYLVGGELKATTEAIVGSEALVNLQKYNFSIGFFGTNGVDKRAGFTTPDINEALIKRCAMEHTMRKYVLCDHEKFQHISAITFGSYESAVILTNQEAGEYVDESENVIIVNAK